MLQSLFPNEQHEPNPLITEVDQLLLQYAKFAANKRKGGEEANKLWAKFETWSIGLKSSLQELYMSHYAAQKYRQKVKSKTFSEMDEEELLNYARYVYFDKNGFIRVFSLLDKLGTFLNEFLQLKTERIKPHFSYFTVLRTMRERGIHKDLMLPLNEIKEASKESTHRLRKRRNTEIHYMNSEMHDDLLQMTRMYGQEIQIENLDEQMNDLTVGLTMAARSIQLTIEYALKTKR